jgi:uncharacterized spore protein YtfJ
METGLLSDTRIAISIGSAMHVGQKVFYPIARVSIIAGKGGIIGCWINPVALLIAEDTFAYAVSLTDETVSMDQLFEMIPSLRDLIETSNGTLR